MKKFKIVILHGIGQQVQGYSKEFQEDLLKRIKKNTKEKFKLSFEEITYSDIIDNKVKTFTDRECKLNVSYEEMREMFNYYANDAIAYGVPSVKKNILKRISERDKPDKQVHTIYVAHSLGGIILFDYLTHFGIVPGSIFTLGSPLGLYLEYQSNKNKIKKITKKPLWINIIGQDDIIAKPLFDTKEVDMNYVAKIGVLGQRQTPFCHTAYFNSNDGNVIKPIAKRISMLIQKKFEIRKYKKYVKNLWNI
ncbi:MAG: hypothetical protein KQ78_02126 [Candidatus Izimaplasma bacterium HR2]|nr:MAG: hypothetical protein KQ78_02126 [Candidatus Izimaplasma bacterium HR2]